MVTDMNASAQEYVLSFIPERIAREITTLCRARQGGISSVRGIRLRKGGRATVVFQRENIDLSQSVSKGEIEETLKKLARGGIYAHKDEMIKGFISPGMGIRVGIAGDAGYEGGALIGVFNVGSLVFRIPTGECAFADELYSVYKKGIGTGMLIYSPPGVGKTTAIRSLAKKIGKDESRLSVCVVDERREFLPEELEGCRVDLLSGYKKRDGIEIATRTLSPDIIMVDEIGADDTEPLQEVVRCGIPIVATVHAKTEEELRRKKNIRPLLELGAFSVAVGISLSNRGYELFVFEL